MKTVNEVSKLTGVSIRTLQYYDKIAVWDKEHMEMLTENAPENFMVKHYVSIANLAVKQH